MVKKDQPGRIILCTAKRISNAKCFILIPSSQGLCLFFLSLFPSFPALTSKVCLPNFRIP